MSTTKAIMDNDIRDAQMFIDGQSVPTKTLDLGDPADFLRLQYGPSVNNGQSVTYPAVPGKYNQIVGFEWEYIGSAINGQIVVLDNGGIVFGLHIDTPGVGYFEFATPLKNSSPNQTLEIQMSPGQVSLASVTSRLEIHGHSLVN